MDIGAIAGMVFDVQHMCIHDGPGLRTTVFLKGCPLKCLWCQNPESQSGKPQLLFRREKCTGCGRCVENCPEKCNIFSEDGKVTTDFQKCIQCMKCTSHCAAGARTVSGKLRKAADILKEVEGDKLFYGREGGMTLSGGEPLAQPLFSKALLQLAKKAGIHTAIESCCYASWETVQSVMEFVDVAILDIKHLDNTQHKFCTGVGNQVILRNISDVSEKMGIPVIIRMPIIPGYNESDKNLHDLGQFVRTNVPTCIEIGLLPFHRMGEGKRAGIGMVDVGFHSEPPEEDRMLYLREIVRSYGFLVK